MRGAEARLDDMLAAAADAAEIARAGKRRFTADTILQRAAKNIVAEIGEAAKAIPDDLLARIGDVNWRSVKGMRDRAIHDYPEVDLELLWETLKVFVPQLARAIRRYRRQSDDT